MKAGKASPTKRQVTPPASKLRLPASKLAATAKPVAAAGKRVVPGALDRAVLGVLRAEEQHALQHALSGKATLLQGSSRARDALLFATAARLAQHPVVVASPRAAELLEQVKLLASVDAVGFGSFVSESARAASKKRMSRAGSLLVVVEPAQLFQPELRQVFSKVSMAVLGIAAAHACSEHAHELSPAYLSLREAVAAFAAPVLATCTRTSRRVVEQITEAIGSDKSGIFSAVGPDLQQAAQVARTAERKSALLATIANHGAPGIVLTATPQEADAVFAELTARGVPCLRAHGGMAAVEQSAALLRFADPSQRLVLVTQSPHANASGLAGCAEATFGLTSAPPRLDLRFVVHYQAPLSPEQHFEDLAWLPSGGYSLLLADSSDAALVQALLAQQRIKPAAVEAMAQALAQAPEDRPSHADTLALRAGTSRRSAERVLSAFADRNLIARENGQISRLVGPEALAAEGRLLSARFATLRAADTARAESLASYVTSRHASSAAHVSINKGSVAVS